MRDRLHRRRQPDRQQEGDQSRCCDAGRAGRRRTAIPLIFFTEASLDLAEDAGADAADGRRPTSSASSSASRAPTRRRCARRRSIRTCKPGGTIVERVHAIQHAGLEVWCGHDRRLRPRRRERLRGSARVLARGAHRAGDDRHAVRRSPRRRCTPGWPPRAGSTRQTTRRFGTNVIPLRLTRAGAARRLRAADARRLRAGGVLRAAGRRACGKRQLARLRRRARATGAGTPGTRERPDGKPGPRRRAVCPPDAARRGSRAPAAVSSEVWRAAARAPRSRAVFGYIIRCAMHYHHMTLAARDGAASGRRSSTRSERAE